MNKLPLFQKGKTGTMHFSTQKQTSPLLFFIIFIFTVFLVFVTLIIRLFQLTIVKGTYYRDLAESNRIREIIIEPKRGSLLDRKGFPIAETIPGTVALNGRIDSRRLYHEPQAVAPISGYLQVADQNDFKNDPCLNKLFLGDKTGKRGVEELYDCDLRGVTGKRLIEVDASGQYKRTLTVIPPKDGKTLQLSIDLELQKKAYELIKDKKAAVIVTQPQTGEILALVSTPSFNPQDFEDKNNTNVTAYLTDKDHPLFNRATEGVYPPGSTFKLVIASGALQEKKIDDKTVIEDKGSIKAGPLSFGNWYFLEYGKTEGMVDILKAIQRSNDIFFYKTGEFLGPENIKKWADKFGFGKKTNIGISESDGLLPSPFWKEEALKEQWYLGDTYNLSIGQGYVLVTPLQIARLTSAIADNGVVCTPHLLKDQPPECKSIGLSGKTLSLIHEGMRRACATGGTGWPLFDFSVPEPFTPDLSHKTGSPSANIIKKHPISVSCKTGTAESSVASASVPHAWFTAYAPSDNPEIAITVLVEEAGQGSDIGGPIVRDILKEYFGRNE